MNQMQAELAGQATGMEIHILGVNGIGNEVGNPSMTQGRSLPWLQDVSAENVWKKWDVTFRDVIILDGENRRVGVFNLTTHDLSNQANYETLKSMLLQAAH